MIQQRCTGARFSNSCDWQSHRCQLTHSLTKVHELRDQGVREDVGKGQCQGEVHSDGQRNLDNDECQIHVSDSIAIHLQ